MPDHAVLIQNFYEAFRSRDAETMASAYHPDSTFDDPVFSLRGTDIGDMWRMFCAGDNELTIEYSKVKAEGEHGSAHWDAKYVFGPKRRAVLNHIDAQFEFEGGLIVSHRDDFDLAAWSGQALGLPGRLFGSSRWLQTKVRSQAAHQLARFQDRSIN